jgi:transcriptional regulator with XRE-family HTH domain
MEFSLTAEQLRAARAMLRLDQAALAAAAGVSVETVKRLERMEGRLSDVRVSTIDALQSALEARGIVFTNGGQPGVAIRATAEGILRAGEMARAGGPALPEPTGLAKQILDAGKRRRGEIE